jgi:hypothetical protein
MSKTVILQLAQKMVDRELGIIEGCHAICQQRPTLEHSDEQADVLLPFIGFESELHNYPIGEARKYWNPEGLLKQDKLLRAVATSVAHLAPSVSPYQARLPCAASQRNGSFGT